MRSAILLAVTVAGALASTSSVRAQAPPALEPQATEALQNMGKYLQSLPALVPDGGAT